MQKPLPFWRVLWSSLVAVATLGLPLEMGTAQTIRRPKLGSATGATLEETLAAGLRCRRPEEFAYVKLVADRVEEGTLPRSLVEGTFFWARRQNQYPYISFRYALELRAKKLGLVL